MSLLEACRTYFETLNHAPMRRAVVGQRGALADAARGVLNGGRHDGPCSYDLPEGACSIHVSTYRMRRAKLLRLVEKALGVRAGAA
jgi:hypothetical protein